MFPLTSMCGPIVPGSIPGPLGKKQFSLEEALCEWEWLLTIRTTVIESADQDTTILDFLG